MGGWSEYALAWAFFLASHALPAQPDLRARLVAATGRGVYLVGYIAVSIAALAWLIVAAGRAPYVPLWDAAAWRALAPPVAMIPACLLVAYAIGAPNPLSFGGAGDDRFDPERPGVVGVARHPLLWALALWSGAHLLANGDLAHALLFGGFLAMSLGGMAMLDARKRRLLGQGAWARLSASTSFWPFAALATGRWRPGGPPGVLRAALAALLWQALIWAHPPVIGVGALP
jgi:uncharacterized membrane protein